MPTTTIIEFVQEFRSATAELTEQDVQNGLGPLLKAERLKGILPVLKTKLGELASFLEDAR